GAWRFYQERFDQRRSADGQQQRFLSAADEVAWDAYKSAIDRAKELGLEPDKLKFKQPPLLHLFGDPSPLTRLRSRHALTPNLPVHVIDWPYDGTATAWSLLALHHEVAHGLVDDWGLNWGSILLTRAQQAG